MSSFKNFAAFFLYKWPVKLIIVGETLLANTWTIVAFIDDYTGNTFVVFEKTLKPSYRSVS